uniref:U5 small nuclear ribonucleoprotein TSSC4 n=1 Tax=Cacopsylla melanoneura TaxID=428564 RepID=A0A8D8YLP5_9HEMI
MSSNNNQEGNSGTESQLLFSNVENDEFKQRQNNLFNLLIKTEKETIKKDSFLAVSNKGTMSEKIKFHRNIRHEYNHTRAEPKPPRKSDGPNTFRVPDNRCISTFRKPHGNRTPDFRVNPHKWTKYTLSDVTENDLSDRSNTNAALSFLNDLKKQKTLDNDSVNMDVDTEGDGKTSKILFKKKSTPRTHTDDSSVRNNSESSGSSNQYVDGKHVMAEYVVGQSNKPKKVKNTDVARVQEKKNNKEIALNHLYEDEEDC